jgi:hypothetical protein
VTSEMTLSEHCCLVLLPTSRETAAAVPVNRCLELDQLAVEGLKLCAACARCGTC